MRGLPGYGGVGAGAGVGGAGGGGLTPAWQSASLIFCIPLCMRKHFLCAGRAAQNAHLSFWAHSSQQAAAVVSVELARAPGLPPSGQKHAPTGIGCGSAQ